MPTKQELLEDYTIMVHQKIKEIQKLSVENVDADVLRVLHDAIKELRFNKV